MNHIKKALPYIALFLLGYTAGAIVMTISAIIAFDSSHSATFTETTIQTPETSARVWAYCLHGVKVQNHDNGAQITNEFEDCTDNKTYIDGAIIRYNAEGYILILRTDSIYSLR